jgi:hypothetical protein
MENKNFTATIEVEKSAKEVFNAIPEVTKWWNKEDFEGNSKKPNDEFVIHHPNQHYSKQKLIEVIPNKKIVWLVTESELNWLKTNKQEWTNTKMIFEITAKDDKTSLYFTHEGLTPEKECYVMCVQGWNMIIKDWLSHFIETGTSSTEMSKASEIRSSLLNNKIKNKSFHRTITANASAEKAFEKIAKVGDWWAKSFVGKALNVGDTFRIEFGTTWVNFKITEAIPNKKIVWFVTDCYLPWLKDKTEWTNTEVVFELSSDNNKTKIDFTHIGLIPEIECYENCEQGWTRFVTISLLKFINEGQGLPE